MPQGLPRKIKLAFIGQGLVATLVISLGILLGGIGVAVDRSSNCDGAGGTNCVVLAGTFWSLAPPSQLLGWLGLAGLLWLLRAAHWLRWRGRPECGCCGALW